MGHGVLLTLWSELIQFSLAHCQLLFPEQVSQYYSTASTYCMARPAAFGTLFRGQLHRENDTEATARREKSSSERERFRNSYLLSKEA